MDPVRALDEDIDKDVWPETLIKVANVIGATRALTLADHCGGVDRVYIPHEPSKNHFWRQVLTPDEWSKICAAFGGKKIELPRGQFVRSGLRKKDIIELAEQGLSMRAIALRTRTTQRYVRRVLQGLGIAQQEDERQRKLFE